MLPTIVLATGWQLITMETMARIRAINAALLFAVLLTATHGWAKSNLRSAVNWQPRTLVNGSPVLFQITAAPVVRSVSANWMGHQLSFFRSGSSWYALAGVPVETAPGFYELRIQESRPAGKPRQIIARVRVTRAKYPSIKIKVARRFTEPNPQQLREALDEKVVKEKTFAIVTPERLWSGSFITPTNKTISDVFGTARVFNGEVKSRHLGLDFAAPTGTPVHAVNQGTVILARPMYFEGNCVVIDHGQGLLSLYLHLSEFRVKEGEEVKSGQIVGLSGGSGRASGPHLHLAIRWQGVYLNPAILLKTQLPTESAPLQASPAGEQSLGRIVPKS